MPNYDLFGLDTRTFQQLCQAIAIAELGAGVVVFGDGRDGNRDAAYNGKLDYPSPANQWDGSLIIQAKYRQEKIDDKQKAGTWLYNAVKADLDKFIGTPNPSTAVKQLTAPPEYYIVISNIALTPVLSTGTDAKIRELLSEYAVHLGFKGTDVWDGNKLERLLDNHRDIAISYAGYITQGDVLTALHASLQQLAPDFSSVMSDFLQSELIGPDQFARLSEAGSTIQRRPLANVCVDLPVSENPSEVSDNESVHTSDLTKYGFLARVLDAAGLRFDRRSVLEQKERDQTGRGEDLRLLGGRITLIGGPGQGKSTLGQFLCQLFRVSILKRRDRETITDAASEAIGLMEAWCGRNAVSLPRVPRFPVRVELRVFADELAAGKCASLIEFIANHIDKRSGRRVERGNLATWLSNYPWLVILDGLDEVPAANNRLDVLDAIQHFTVQIATCRADVFLITTSRPQGYEGAFEQNTYVHYHLLPLPTELALEYARQLTSACHPTDAEKQKEILDRLERSSRSNSARRLMRSPLQVTILAVVAELFGELPDNRWDLFQQYYETIYKRETQRNQALAPILREYRQEISIIHERVGLRLQMLNEEFGANDALLSRSQLVEILRECLTTRIDSEDPQFAIIVKQIEIAALERLVFLVSPKGEGIGFEVRSLQEFFAARALTNGSDSQICERLGDVAGYPYWRNVFLFGAGRVSRERSYLNDSIVGLCATLNNNEDERIYAMVLAGSLLAIDLLRDGIFSGSRAHSLALLDVSLRLLTSPQEEAHFSIAAICHRYQLGNANVEKQIRILLQSQDLNVSEGGWRVLLQLIELGEPWAVGIADEYWPERKQDRLGVLRTLPRFNPGRSSWFTNKAIENADGMIPYMVNDYVPEDQRPAWLATFAKMHNVLHKSRIPIHINRSHEPCFTIRFTAVSDPDESWGDLLDAPFDNGYWGAIKFAAEFALTPSKEKLSQILTKLATLIPTEGTELMYNCAYNSPWPLAACIYRARSAEKLQELSQEVISGAYGDTQNWLDIEKGWMQEGLNLQSISSSCSVPGREIRNTHHSWVYFIRLLSCEYQAIADVQVDLQRMAEEYELQKSETSPNRLWALIIGESLNEAADRYDQAVESVFQQCPSPSTFHAWFGEYNAPTLSVQFSNMLRWEFPLSDEWLTELDTAARRMSSSVEYRVYRPNKQADRYQSMVKSLAAGYLRDSSRKGLIRLINKIVHLVPFEPLIPASELWPAPTESPEFRAEALSLLLFWGQLKLTDVDRLVETMRSLFEDKTLTTRSFPSFGRLVKHCDQEWTREFIHRIFESQNTGNAHLKLECINWSAAYLSRRPSPFRSTAENTGRRLC